MIRLKMNGLSVSTYSGDYVETEFDKILSLGRCQILASKNFSTVGARLSVKLFSKVY